MNLFHSRRRRALYRWGDRFALLLITSIYIVGFLTRGYAGSEPARLFAWTACGALGLWALLCWGLGRWNQMPFRAHPRFLVLLGAVVLIMAFYLIPLPQGLTTSISPHWNESVEAIEAIGGEAPGSLPLSLAPAKARISWNQLFASLMFFAGVSTLVTKRRNVRFLIRLVAAAAIFEGLLGVVNFGLGRADRVSAAIFNPNHHSTMVLMGFPAALAILWRLRHQRVVRHASTGPALFLTGLAMVALIGALASLSRTGLLSGGVVLVGWLGLEWYGQWRATPTGYREPWKTTPQQKIMVALLAGVFVLLTMSAALVEGYARRFGEGEDQVSRGALMRATWEGFQANHFVGVGLGGTEYMINQYANFATIKNAIWTHNDFLQIVVELGAPGVLICLPILLWMLFGYKRDIRMTLASRHWERNLLSRAALAGVLITLLHAFADFHLRIPLVGFQFLILFALSAAAVNAGLDDSRPVTRR